MISSVNFIFDFSTQIYTGQFKFGGEYQNNLCIYTDKKIIELNRVYSPPHDKSLNILVKEKNNTKITSHPKHDTRTHNGTHARFLARTKIFVRAYVIEMSVRPSRVISTKLQHLRLSNLEYMISLTLACKIFQKISLLTGNYRVIN